MLINFHAEDSSPPPLDTASIAHWLEDIAANEGLEIDEINYVFCSDEHLLSINRQYLHHDYYTDIITFDYSEDVILAGDIYISLDRVRENASTFKDTFERELHRVMVHGLLHLMGYQDKSDEEAKEMRSKENLALSLL
ncbi:MAG: rRNA maturation RNase YbeY [Bacteroidota bacterium]